MGTLRGAGHAWKGLYTNLEEVQGLRSVALLESPILVAGVAFAEGACGQRRAHGVGFVSGVSLSVITIALRALVV